MEEINLQPSGVLSDGAAQSQQQPEHFAGDLECEGQEQGKTFEVEEKLEFNRCHVASGKEQSHVQQQNTQQRLGEVGGEGQGKQREMKEIMPKKQEPSQGNREVICTLKGEIPKGEEHKREKKNVEQPPRKQNKNAEAQQQKQTKKLKDPVSENQERINYLVQVSKVLATMPPPHHKENSPRNHECADQALASQTGALAAAIGRRCVMRLSPALKRSLCKGCGVALVYGVNARVRHKSRRQKHLVVTCLACRTIKRFVNDPKHKLWCEQEEAIL
ncbi:uncharacterized protein LOC134771636 [Penaeus indicus]|uniref:uncharacterized protein LOC134771636 n=1 Tax=Penaeus indicus TaxID=29960 RepID=UPI00300CB660